MTLRRDAPVQLLHDRMDGAVRAAGVPGAVAVVADRDGVIYEAAFGRRSVADEAPMTLDTIFLLASMTKAVTSVAALQLVEDGRLVLDDPIHPLLPELADPKVLTGFDADGAPQLRPAARPITLRHLLTHTSGFGYDTFNADLLRARGPAGPGRPGQRAGLNGPLLFDPGEGWEYGVSTDWVGLAVEAASGQRLDAYFDEHIFRPLKMTDTAFLLSAEQQARKAGMHQRGSDGVMSPIPCPVAEAANWELRLGGAGLLGTGGDYVRFMRMILNGGVLEGARVLSRRSVQMMSENQVGSIRAGAFGAIFPTLNNPFDPLPDAVGQWGLGFLINPEPAPNGRAGGSLSWAGLANTYYWIDPASGLCAVLLAQFLPFADTGALTLLQVLEEGVYA